ncbi:MAG: hypothetical protein IJW51_03540 [Clostridia bacterium]|nr:hypothetical protein [Clostridia bacterium]
MTYGSTPSSVRFRCALHLAFFEGRAKIFALRRCSKVEEAFGFFLSRVSEMGCHCRALIFCRLESKAKNKEPAALFLAGL